METIDSDIPLPQAKVAVIYNLQRPSSSNVVDDEAEYDHIETIKAIQEALLKHGIPSVGLEADQDLANGLKRNGINLAFNIAEGRGGRGREAQVPALLDMMGVAYTGSDETTLCLALDKALTKRLLNTYHIRSPHSIVISSKDKSPNLHSLRFPIIVKPNAEGSSKGISNASIVTSPESFKELIKRDQADYDCDLLAEEYIEGREFTVGLLGNGADTTVFRPMQIVFTRPTQDDYHVYSYAVKQNYKQFVRYESPGDLSEQEEKRMTQTAKRIYEALNCRDFARVDFRVDGEGNQYFIEINPLPGLAPDYSDYPMLAGFCGVEYDELVYGILNSAAKRCKIALTEEGASV